MKKTSKLHKKYCEIEDCNETNPKVLHFHHIIERKQIGTSNSPWNTAVICSNCHAKIHCGIIKIIGVFPATNPQGRILVYEQNGIKNVDLSESYFNYQMPQMKISQKD